MPNDISLAGVYVPPLLVAAVAGLVAASLTSRVLNRTGWVKHLSNPPLVYVAMVALYTVLFGSTVFPT